MIFISMDFYFNEIGNAIDFYEYDIFVLIGDINAQVCEPMLSEFYMNIMQKVWQKILLFIKV